MTFDWLTGPIDPRTWRGKSHLDLPIHDGLVTERRRQLLREEGLR